MNQNIVVSKHIIGRLVQEKGSRSKIAVNDAGMEFTLVHFSTPLPKYGHDHDASEHCLKYLHKVPMANIVNYDTPLCFVTITQFEGGGSALGVSLFLQNLICCHTFIFP
jgi:hypothetical protein